MKKLIFIVLIILLNTEYSKCSNDSCYVLSVKSKKPNKKIYNWGGKHIELILYEEAAYSIQFLDMKKKYAVRGIIKRITKDSIEIDRSYYQDLYELDSVKYIQYKPVYEKRKVSEIIGIRVRMGWVNNKKCFIQSKKINESCVQKPYYLSNGKGPFYRGWP